MNDPAADALPATTPAPAIVPTVLKVSVVVPTYRSGEGLDRLVASLDAQTLPATEFEVIFVDDGSPDDTYDRLLRVQATRPNVRVERIENSGWPCRPRNIGTDLAGGEYVAYMDHDDLLYPDALRAAYEFGSAHGADVVNGKEARTHDPSWAIDLYREDAGQSIGRGTQHPLIPMNPHKLYRRAFLDEHGIRFREGGRVMWEDIFFNVLVDRHARVIATLASVPYYHWYMTRGSGSKGFLRSGDEFWHWLREVLTAIDTDLAGDEHARSRDLLLAHQYRSRILGSFNGQFLRRPAAERAKILQQCRDLQRDFSLTRLDDRLSSSGRVRAALLAAGADDLLSRIATHDPGIPGWGRATAVRWVDGCLVLDLDAEWSSAAGRRHALRRDGDRIRKVLPAAYDGVLDAGVLDVTDEVHGATVEVGLRSRESRVTWMAPSSHELTVSDAPGGGVAFAATARGTVDPDALVFGRPLEDGLWDLNVRCMLAGSSTQQAMRCDLEPSAAAKDGRLRVAYTNLDGRLTMSLGRAHDVASRLLPSARDAVITRAAGGLRLTVPLQDAVADGGGAYPATVRVAPRRTLGAAVRHRLTGAEPFRDVPATLQSRDGRLVLEVALPDGWRSGRVRVGHQHPRGPRWWQVGAELTAGPEQVVPAPARIPLRERVRRAAGRARRAIRAVRNRLR